MECLAFRCRPGHTEFKLQYYLSLASSVGFVVGEWMLWATTPWWCVVRAKRRPSPFSTNRRAKRYGFARSMTWVNLVVSGSSASRILSWGAIGRRGSRCTLQRGVARVTLEDLYVHDVGPFSL